VNLQAPFERDGGSFRTLDHELDIWIMPDGSWQWKDVEKLHDWVRRGRFTEEEAAEIRAEGESVLAEWPFPTGLGGVVSGFRVARAGASERPGSLRRCARAFFSIRRSRI